MSAAPQSYHGLISSAYSRPQAYTFNARGPLAILPSALAETYGPPPSRPAVNAGPAVALIEVVGPLMHHADWLFDSYDGIKSRVAAALASPAPIILMSIDSPGGLLAGCFDTVREIRAMVEAAGKHIYTYVDSMAASAAYALALVGERIYIPPTGIVGSIGVVETLVSAKRAESSAGLDFEVVASGARKGDGNPHAEITPEARAALQTTIDGLADQFFNLVSTYRPVKPEDVKSLEAGVLVGAQAIAAGLADEIASLDQVLALLSEGPPAISSEGNTMQLSELKQALQAVVDNKEASNEEREEALKMLRACDSKEAEDEAPEKKDEPEGKLAIRALRSELNDVKKAQLLATRPDFTAEQIATLKRSPLSVVSDAVKSWPRAIKAETPTGHVQGAIAALNVHGTQGETPDAPKADPNAGMSEHEIRLLAKLDGPKIPEGPYTDSEGFFRTPSLTRSVWERFNRR